MPYFGKRKGAAITRHPKPETYRRSAITNEPSGFAQIPIRAPPLSQLVMQKYNRFQNYANAYSFHTLNTLFISYKKSKKKLRPPAKEGRNPNKTTMSITFFALSGLRLRSERCTSIKYGTSPYNRRCRSANLQKSIQRRSR